MRATAIENGIILYVQKDNLKTISFPIKQNTALGDKIIERFEILHKSLIENQMPEAEAKASDDDKWMCDYCSWKGECE